MPKIHEEGSWRVVIHTDDHPPPHVHVYRPGGLVKVHLAGDNGEPEVVRIHHVSDRDAWRALSIVYEHQQAFLQHWSSIHGQAAPPRRSAASQVRGSA